MSVYIRTITGVTSAAPRPGPRRAGTVFLALPASRSPLNPEGHGNTRSSTAPQAAPPVSLLPPPHALPSLLPSPAAAFPAPRPNEESVVLRQCRNPGTRGNVRVTAWFLELPAARCLNGNPPPHRRYPVSPPHLAGPRSSPPVPCRPPESREAAGGRLARGGLILVRRRQRASGDRRRVGAVRGAAWWWCWCGEGEAKMVVRGGCSVLVMVVLVVRGRGRVACRPRLPCESRGANDSTAAGENLRLPLPPPPPNPRPAAHINPFLLKK